MVCIQKVMDKTVMMKMYSFESVSHDAFIFHHMEVQQHHGSSSLNTRMFVY